MLLFVSRRLIHSFTFKELFQFQFSSFSFEVEKFARNTGLQFFRTSVKENLNICHVFYHLAEKYVESISRWSDESPNAVYQIDERQSEVRVRFAGLPNSEDSEGNNYARLYFSRRKKSNGSNVNNNNNQLQHQHQQQQQMNNNKKNNKSHYEMPFVVNRFYFHDPNYPRSPFINPDKKVISLKMFDSKKREKSNNPNFPNYYSCNRLLTMSPNEKDSKNAICSVL